MHFPIPLLEQARIEVRTVANWITGKLVMETDRALASLALIIDHIDKLSIRTSAACHCHGPLSHASHSLTHWLGVIGVR